MHVATSLSRSKQPRRGPLLALGVVGATLALAACGDDSDSTSTEAEGAATAEVAIEEAEATRGGLEEAAAAYEKGDEAEAEQLAGDAYLEHFEIVEGPLEEVDPELNESLEELIREELRTAITDGAPAGDVSALVEEASTGLDVAVTALEGSATSGPSGGY